MYTTRFSCLEWLIFGLIYSNCVVALQALQNSNWTVEYLQSIFQSYYTVIKNCIIHRALVVPSKKSQSNCVVALRYSKRIYCTAEHLQSVLQSYYSVTNNCIIHRVALIMPSKTSQSNSAVTFKVLQKELLRKWVAPVYPSKLPLSY